MATVYITAAGGDIDLSSTGIYSGAALPSADDILEFRGPNDGGVVQYNITAGHAALTNDLQRIRIYPGVSISTGATPLQVTVSNVSTVSNPGIEFMGATHGQFNLTSGAAIDNLVVISDKSPSINITGGAVPFILNERASVTIGASVTATTAYCFGGTMITYPNITTAEIDGGAWEQRAGTVTTGRVDGSGRYFAYNTAAVTTMNGHGNGMVMHRGSGTIGTLNLRGFSVYDPSMAPINPTVTTVNLYGKNPTYYSQAGQITVNNTTLTTYGGGKAKTKG